MSYNTIYYIISYYIIYTSFFVRQKTKSCSVEIQDHLLLWNLLRPLQRAKSRSTCRSSLVSGTWVNEKMAVLRQCWGESVRRPGASSFLSVAVCLWRLQRGSRPVISPRAQPPAERPGLEWLIHWVAALPLSIIHSSFTSPFSFDFAPCHAAPICSHFCSSHFVPCSALLLFILYKKRLDSYVTSLLAAITGILEVCQGHLVYT